MQVMCSCAPAGDAMWDGGMVLGCLSAVVAYVPAVMGEHVERLSPAYPRRDRTQALISGCVAASKRAGSLIITCAETLIHT